MKIWSRVVDAIARDGACAVVTIADVRGSAPREAGARMLVLDAGGFHGTIGGGTLEWEAIASARKAMKKGRASARLIRQALGPELGQCCGGSVRLLFEVFDEDKLGEAQTLAEREHAGPFTTEGLITSDGIRRKIIDVAGSSPHSESASLELPDRLTEHFGQSPQSVVLFGAGHVGRALMMSLAPLPFEVVWVDQREDAFPPVMPANIVPRCRDDVSEELENAPDGSFVVVMTHSHGLDLDIVHAALSANRFGYVGLIGSATKRARFEHRLRDAGVADTQIAQLICPIGIEGITTKEPAGIAVSVAAQLLACSENNLIGKSRGV